MQQQSGIFKVVRPDNRVSESIFSALFYLANEIWRFRSHIKVVFFEQFRASYSGTGLGVVWNYLLPIVPLTVYWFLSMVRVFPSFEGVEGATFLTFGVTLWFLLSGCVQVPLQVVRARNREVMKTSFPLSASIVSGFASLLFETSIRVLFVIGIIFITKDWPNWQVVFLPLILLPAFLLFLGLGLILGVLNVIYRDISRIVDILLRYGIFVSGVLFPFHNFKNLMDLNLYNPFAIYIEASRTLTFKAEIFGFESYIWMSSIAILFFLFSVRAFYVMEYRVRGID